MLKRLGITAAWVLGILLIVGAIVLVTYEEHDAEVKYKRECQEHSAAVVSPGQGKSQYSADQCRDPKEYMPWWYVLVAWPEGITTWALLFTLGAIAWQSSETRKAAIASGSSVEVMKRQADLMEQQNRNVKSKDRARIAIHLERSEFPITDMRWSIRFSLENIGSSDAFDVWVWAGFEFNSSFVPPRIEGLAHIKRIVRIRTSRKKHFEHGPVTVSRDPRGWSEVNADWDAARNRKVADGDLFLHMRGTVEYKDVFGDSHVEPFRFFWLAELVPNSWGDAPNPRWIEAVHGEDPKST